MNAYRLPHVADEPDLREVEFPFRQILALRGGLRQSREAAHLLIAAAGNRAAARTTAAISVILL
ncbi:MAG: hypothetical protein WA743_16795 [Pseudolabrys sp.]|jgi:hypothetical protein